MMEKEIKNEKSIDFEKVSLEELEEVEEVVTPFDGTIGCCD